MLKCSYYVLVAHFINIKYILAIMNNISDFYGLLHTELYSAVR